MTSAAAAVPSAAPLSGTKNASSPAVLKLKADDYKTIDQLKTAQYSIRPRYISKDPDSYQTASKLPKVDPSILKLRSDSFYASAPYGDFRDELIEKGYCVVKGAIPRGKAADYEQKIHDWMKSFKCTEGLDLSDPETFVEQNLPSNLPNAVYTLYSVPHEKFMWDARQEPGVIDAFAKIWGTDELLVSFDGFNFSLPHRKDVPEPQPWPHVDQSPYKSGMQCVQGVINLSDSSEEDDATLVVLKGSTKILEEFFQTQVDKANWLTKDFRYFSNAELLWFKERGCEFARVKAEPGDLILWDSRTIHYGGSQGPESNKIRTVIYACYTPAEFASKEALLRKASLFEQWKGSNHWPHDNIVLRNSVPLTANYEVDPEDRAEPLEKPIIDDKLAKLAGLKAYR